MTETERRIIDEARAEPDTPSPFDLHPSRDFDDPNACADFIMRALYDGPESNPWVVAILGHTGLFFPYREIDCLDEGRSYFRITWDCCGCRILEGEL